MPATDPINVNVHPLIYRWNGILGQSQAAALEAAGKDGIIYNSTYTNFWEGAMAWSGWWHNQIGLLTEVASARIAAPIDQRRAVPGRPAVDSPSTGAGRAGGEGAGRFDAGPIPAPTDITPRTEYPRPWMGGHWTLRDIVDYELDRDDGAARDGGGSPRDDRAADLRGEPADDRRREERQSLVDSGTGREPARRARSGASGRSVEHGRRRRLPGGCRIRGRRQDVRRRHVRDPDDAGVRALREGHAREADVSRGAPRAPTRRPSRRTTSPPGRSACCSASTRCS